MRDANGKKMDIKLIMGFKRKWGLFQVKHPKLALILFQYAKFYVISLLVTLLQYHMLTFLPQLIHSWTSWSDTAFQFIPVKFLFINTYVFDYPVTGTATGGLGYFIAFAFTLFIAQCVNFPLQRNVTFKSKGNVIYQAMWYFIAFVLITCVCSFLSSIYVPLLRKY